MASFADCGAAFGAVFPGAPVDAFVPGFPAPPTAGPPCALARGTTIFGKVVAADSTPSPVLEKKTENGVCPAAGESSSEVDADANEDALADVPAETDPVACAVLRTPPIGTAPVFTAGNRVIVSFDNGWPSALKIACAGACAFTLAAGAFCQTSSVEMLLLEVGVALG